MGKIRHCEEEAFYEAVLSMKTIDECRMFFADSCTIKELQAMAQRFQVARQLDQGHNYMEVCEATGASSATISRVNKCLTYGEGGYRIALERTKKAEEIQNDGCNSEK